MVDKGPYATVRHPGYVAAIVAAFCIPITLNSLWALEPVGLYTLIFVIRTALEHRTLQKELAEYSEYASTVKYRLIPGEW